MALFEYTAYDAQGKIQKGLLEADSEKRARQDVLAKGLMVTSVKQSGKGVARWGKIELPTSFFNRKQSQRLASFTRQLSTLLSSGVPLAEAIDILIKQMPDVQMEKSLRVLCQDIRTGQPFAAALENQPESFSSLYINMVRAGENSGHLDVVLRRLSQYLQLRQQIQAKIQTAMTYPAFIAGVALLLFLVIMFFLVPKVAVILTDMGQTLPLATQVVIGFSELLVHWWPLVGIGSCMFLFGVNRLFKSKKFRLLVDERKFKMPILGAMMQKGMLSRFSLTLSTLLQSGIPAMESLTIVGDAMSNKYVNDQLKNAETLVRDGKNLSTALEAQPSFPPLVTFMIAVGEKSGELPTLLEDMGNNFNEELDTEMQRAVAILEPIIILCMAVVVVAVILSILLPIMQMTGSFQ